MDLSSELSDCYCGFGGFGVGEVWSFCFYTQIHIGVEFKSNYIVAISGLLLQCWV